MQLLHESRVPNVSVRVPIMDRMKRVLLVLLEREREYESADDDSVSLSTTVPDNVLCHLRLAPRTASRRPRRRRRRRRRTRRF